MGAGLLSRLFEAATRAIGSCPASSIQPADRLKAGLHTLANYLPDEFIPFQWETELVAGRVRQAVEAPDGEHVALGETVDRTAQLDAFVR